MNQPAFKIKKTSDGSDTLYSEEMVESYHSLNGAVQESMHVFIEAGFNQIFKPLVRVFEVGFGTGLNCILTWREAIKRNIMVEYETIEAFPVRKEIYENLNYNEVISGMEADALKLLHESRWEEWHTIEKDLFSIYKIYDDFIGHIIINKFDLVYYDAFAPNKQSELWEEKLFSKLFTAMNPGGLLVTYCAMGEVRRRLQRVGFLTERLPGPPGKREMLRAVKLM